MRLAVNVAFLFTEQPYLDRFGAARQAGFTAVELPWPELPPPEVAAAIADAGVAVVQCNAHAGDLAAGERGYANDPARRPQWRAALDAALDWSAAVGCPGVNVLAGNRLDGVDEGEQRACLVDNLAWALPRARRRGITLLLEVLNDRDTPRYLFTRLAAALDLLREFDDPALRLQFDTYHLALMEGPVAPLFASVGPLVGHVQLADAPGRGEPGTGLTDFGAFFDQLHRSGYAGAVSLEYVPSVTTERSLSWLPWSARGADPATLPGVPTPLPGEPTRGSGDGLNRRQG